MSRTLSAEFDPLPALSQRQRERFPEVRAAILAANPALAPVMTKLAGRANALDKDLCNVSPTGLLVVAWDLADHDVSIVTPTLVDMGATCLQGDTHRLFSLIVALQRANDIAASTGLARAPGSV